MITHYIASAWHALLKHRYHSILNILGFSLALCVVILIGMYTSRELTANMFHRDADRIYKISGWGCPYALCGVIKDGVPEIEAAANVMGSSKGQLLFQTTAAAERVITTDGYLMVDSSFFDVFTFPVIAGDPHNPLPTTESVALSQTMAKALFGDSDPIGRPLLMSGQRQLVVSAVMADVPLNSSIRFSAILPNNPNQIMSGGTTLAQNWGRWNYEIFARIAPNQNIDALNKKIQEVVTQNGNLQYEIERVMLYPLSDVYFNYADLYTNFKGGNHGQVKAMLWVGIIILILAIVNFFNLSTASGMTRSKEIGLRKVNGATRRSLIIQFMFESIMITFLATLIALLLVNLALPKFNELVGMTYPYIFMNQWWQWVGLIGISVVVGTVSGSYPAFYTSGVDPINALYTGRVRTGFGALFFRKALIVFQLIASIGIIVCTLVISAQLKHLTTKDLGFDKEQIMLVGMDAAIYKQKQSFISEISALPFVQGVTITTSIIGDTDAGGELKAMYRGEEKQIWSKSLPIDTAFFSTFGIEMVQGRAPKSTEIGQYVLNEAAMKALGVEDYTQIEIIEESRLKGAAPELVKVVGVCRDFNFKPLKHGVEPLAIQLYDIPSGLINIRVDATSVADLDNVNESIKNIYKKFNDIGVVQTSPLDDELAQLYVDEKRFQTIFSVFALFAVLISCFGLFGLIIFSNARRRKEIGVRRVNGSTIWMVIRLLISSYVWYVVVAFVVATPIAYYVMSQWLSGYVYRTELSWWIFPLAGVMALVVVVLTVGLQSWHAATANPVKSLKSE